MRDLKKGEKLVFDRVLMLGSDTYQIGKPYVTNAKVTATVTSMGSDGTAVRMLSGFYAQHAGWDGEAFVVHWVNFDETPGAINILTTRYDETGIQMGSPIPFTSRNT